jgi:hypothetical protein
MLNYMDAAVVCVVGDRCNQSMKRHSGAERQLTGVGARNLRANRREESMKDLLCCFYGDCSSAECEHELAWDDIS